eukprot:4506180-Pyramimonas_sp.AAC.1
MEGARPDLGRRRGRTELAHRIVTCGPAAWRRAWYGVAHAHEGRALPWSRHMGCRRDGPALSNRNVR